MKLEALINEHFDSLTPADRETLGLITADMGEIATLSSEALASRLGVSRTSLLRLFNKLGIATFAEFKYLLRETEKAETRAEDADLLLACKNYHYTIDEIKKRSYTEICEMLYQAPRIYVYGTGNAQKSEAEEFKRIFSQVGKWVIDLFDLGEVVFAKERMTPADLFVIISLSGETPEGVEVLKTIQGTKIKTLSITRFANNTIARLCAQNLYVTTKKWQGYRNFSYELMAPFYVLFDMLFVSYLDYEREAKSCASKD